jgi:endonuclease YncB( thermonuclease family)
MNHAKHFTTETQRHGEERRIVSIFGAFLKSLDFTTKPFLKVSSVSLCLRGAAFVFIFFMIVADICHARTVNGLVRTVYDGDTLLLLTRNQSKLKVRLYGIDAPETKKPETPGQPYGSNAKRTLMYKIVGRQVQADVIDVDQYQRAVAVIRYEGRDINREMVAEGMAWAYRNYLKGVYASEYIGAEQGARSRRIGLWRDSNPQPPWEFRQAHKGKRKGKHHDWW